MCQERKIAKRMNVVVSLGFGMAIERPMGHPFTRHHMLDGEPTPCDAFIAEARFSIPPSNHGSGPQWLREPSGVVRGRAYGKPTHL